MGGYPGGGGFPGGGGGYPGGAYGQPTGPFSILVQKVEANYTRTTEDRLGGQNFTIRDRVTSGTILAGNGAYARLSDVYALKSRYRTVTSRGGVNDHGIASASKPGAYVALPMIDLGGGRRRVGQTWNTRVPVLLEWATMDAPPTVVATNTLETLEWQDGYQTARIRQTYKGKANIPIHGGAGTMRQADVNMDRTIWFAYKPGQIVRQETTMQVNGDAPANIVQAMVPSAGIGGGMVASGGGPSLVSTPDLDNPESMIGTTPGLAGGGLPGGSFGALRGSGAQDSPLVPVKFRSETTVLLAP